MLKNSLIVFLLFVTGSNDKNNSLNKIEIHLNKVSDKNILFNKLYTTIEFSSNHISFPKYYNYLIDNYKGLPKSDSLYILYNNADFKKFVANLYNKGFIDYEKLNQYKIDLNEEKNKPELKQLSLVTYFKKNYQYIIVDKNQNWDFSDDKILKVGYDTKIENLKETLYYKFWQKIDSEFIYFNRFIELIPTSLHLKNKQNNISEISFRFKDYWASSFKINNETFDVAINGVYPYLDILIKPRFIDFSTSNYQYNLNLKYALKDTISLKDSLYILDKINPQTNKITLKKIKSVKHFIPSKIGSRFYDFKLKDLKNKNFYISNFTTKKYTLIDFWGTWCGPCKQTTPKLKYMNQKYSNKLNIIGIAYDKDIDEVNKYISTNNIKWINSFSKKSEKTSIIDDLKINQYPTFILLDEYMRIIYRGPGNESLIEIEKIINEN